MSPAPNPVSEEVEELEVGTESTRVSLRLRHLVPSKPGMPAVMLTHGGNTRSDIYLVPQGGLAGHLQRAGYDVWLLDWRASPHVTLPLQKRPLLGGSRKAEIASYTLDEVAREDIPEALRCIRQHIGDERSLSVVSFCLSAGATSMAIARGALEPFDVTNVVLLTLGLFYRVPWNGWLKAEDYVIERAMHGAPEIRGIDPNTPREWPKEMAAAYARWPGAWLPEGSSPSDEMLKHLTFMVGRPYTQTRLHPELRRADVTGYFGPLHLGLYLHTSQMVRRGFSAPFNDPEVIEPAAHGHQKPLGDLLPDNFRTKNVTLVAAGQDELWHRDSIDTMYDWLRSNRCTNCSKIVFPGYNIQELLWGERAPRDVFSAVERGLRAKPRRPSPRPTLGAPPPSRIADTV